MAKVCAIYGKELGVMTPKIPLKDAILCVECGQKLPRLPVTHEPYTLEQAKKIIQQAKSKEEYEARGYEGKTPEYVVLQAVLKEAFIGTGSGNLSELEAIINLQASKGYRLHTISTTSSGSKGLGGGDRIQATMVFERL